MIVPNKKERHIASKAHAVRFTISSLFSKGALRLH